MWYFVTVKRKSEKRTKESRKCSESSGVSYFARMAGNTPLAARIPHPPNMLGEGRVKNGKPDNPPPTILGGVGEADPWAALKKQIKVNEAATPVKGKTEGTRHLHVIYEDDAPEKNETIGYGHKLTAAEKASGVFKGGLTDAQAEALFEKDFKIHLKHAQAIPGYKSAPKSVQGVLIDMTFNMGGGWQSKGTGWPDTMKALKGKEWGAMADGMVDSKWYGQVKSRAVRNVATVRNTKNPQQFTRLSKRRKTFGRSR